MGMFDSLFVKCPKCNKELEFQSKSGPCCLLKCKKFLPPDIAVGMDGDIVECEFCRSNIKLKCNIPRDIKIKLVVTKKEADYNGNYNKDLPKNIKRSKELNKLLGTGR